MGHSFTLLVGQSLAAQSDGTGSLLQMALIVVPMIAVMYFLMIRPERKRQTETQGMIAALKRGDEVVLTSGIIGKIHSMDDKSLVIEVADKVRIKVLKVAISGPASRYLGGGEPKKDEKAEKAESKPESKDEKKGDEPEKKSA